MSNKHGGWLTRIGLFVIYSEVSKFVGEENTVRSRLAPFLLIIGVSALAHLWCLGSVFFLDDILQIRDNSWLRDGEWWKAGLLKWTYFSYWVQTKIWGFSPVGFHFVNWLLHTSVAVALYVFGRDCLSWKNARQVSLAGALLFVTHPLASEIPNYARTQDLAWVTLFSILAAWAAVRLMRGFSWGLLVAVILLCVGATFSKGPGLCHAVMMVFVALVACAEREHWKVFAKRWWVVVGVLLSVSLALWLSGITGMLYAKLVGRVDLETHQWHGVTICRVFWKFVGLFFLPKDLCADHFIAGTLSWEDEEAVPAVVGMVLWLLVSTGLIIWKKTRFFGMCLWLFVGAMAMRVLYYINEFMPEYRIYPGLPWMCLGVMVALSAGWSRLTKVSPLGLVGAFVAVLCLVSAKRSFQWHSLERLTAATLEVYPGQARALWMLQRRDADLGDWDSIIKRQQDFPKIQKAFVMANKEMAPGKAMSAGHFIMAELACTGYFAEAIAAKGNGREVVAGYLSMERWLNARGIERGTEKAIWGTYDRALGRVYEQSGELEKALESLERVEWPGKQYLDIARVKAKIAERDKDKGPSPESDG